MKYDPARHHRRSIRLRGYDYSQQGAYFITICTHQRWCIFGHVENKEMVLNEYGQVAYREWEKLPERWPQVALGAFQIMPNHIHGIIIIRDVASHVGVPLAGTLAAEHITEHDADAQPTEHDTDAQNTDYVDDPATTLPVAAASGTRVPARGTPTVITGDNVAGDDPIGADNGLSANAPTEMRITQIQWATKPTAGQIVGAYQSLVSTGCLKIAKSKQPEQILGKLWQRNFWEHIIRDVRAFDMISHYIVTNPTNWEMDKLYRLE